MESHLLAVLTAVNLGLLGYQSIPALHPPGPPEVLRGRGLEIVDDRGKVRASITLYTEDSSVLFRLMTSEGRPNVKLGAGENGSGLLIGGKSDPTYVQVLAEGAKTTVRLKDKDGRERVIQP